MTNFEFLNVDLEIRSRSNLEPFLSELGDRIFVLYSESKPNKHFAAVEIGRYWKNRTPDKTIAALCDLLETISPKARAVWKESHSKVFDIGLDVDPKASHLYQPLSNQSLRRIANLGATIVFTCYNRSNFRDSKPPKPAKTKVIKCAGKHPVKDIDRPITRTK